jgi:hypothetical protein
LKSLELGMRFAASVVPPVTDVFEEKKRTRENPPEGLETPGMVELCDNDQTFGSSPCPPAALLAMRPIVAGAVGGGNGTSVQVPDLFLCLSLSLAQSSGQVASPLYLWA